MGQISKWVIAPLICFLLVIPIATFYTAGTTPTTNNPTPPYQSNNTVSLQFFKGVNTFISSINSFTTAVKQITRPQTTLTDQSLAFIDASISIVRILASFPLMIGGFIYDIANLFFTVLPDNPDGTLVSMLGIISIIAITLFMFAIANIIRPSSSLGGY